MDARETRRRETAASQIAALQLMSDPVSRRKYQEAYNNDKLAEEEFTRERQALLRKLDRLYGGARNASS